ncbi:S66 peptidase family protein [Actinokineospora globicatena]|uniref:S66 peptidase family protein n=1 Tax=Actinokineospora globicatena TaxID=103729 RepID=UPI0024A2ED49|nr:S66 peptidase family protein [Actinokineospora globicatena]MCP2305010.1 Muramoyltetrapeptide carboxypeptidase LdcA (peptidoglycan recycling) [Actinokineospora globicatena]GLW80472.1 LD-carboxypeptidase [Actinokineospora globicatena]GLW87300.1 LD-carboxypeptidase [Actinokineospora globicatena]
MDLVLPPALPLGGTVAVVSPSAAGMGELPVEAGRGVGALQALGYEVRVMGNARGVRGWTSGTVGERREDLHAAFADPGVDAVLYALGGQHSAQLLPTLDFDLIAANPKVFCGYSDATTLLAAVHQRTGLVTFYGPALIPQFGELPEPYPETVEHFTRVVGTAAPAGVLPRFDYEVVDLDFDRREREQRPRDRREPQPRKVLRRGRARGPALAACLPSLCTLVGTPWMPDLAGRVLLLETPEPPYSPGTADAHLWHLRNAGVLDDVAAVVFGRPLGWSAEEAVAFEVAAVDCLEALSVPVVAEVEFGHTNPIWTIPLGIDLEVDGDELAILGAGVR